jgi:erythromycin esterase
MTENLEWILEEEGAGAKVVLWAHNMHVARKPQNGIEYMGSRLSKRMGADLVVLGFAFNRGAFQARNGLAGPVQTFTVPPAPGGSMDAVLAASGVRIGVIDLRQAPAGAREWLTEPRGTRNIGAAFSSSAAMRVSPFPFSEAYDGLIFVEETTAARPNPGGRLPQQAPTFPSPQNLDFEAPEALSGWQSLATPNSGFVTGVTGDQKVSGKQAAFVGRSDDDWPGEFYGNLSQQISATPYHGKRVRLSAHVRADVQEQSGSGHLWLKISAASPLAVPLSLQNSADRPIRAQQWKEMVLEADVPKGAAVISYGLAFNGVGRVMIDNVLISTVEP